MSLVRDWVNAKIFLDNSGPQMAKGYFSWFQGYWSRIFKSLEPSMNAKTRGIVSHANRNLIGSSSCLSLILTNSYLTPVSSWSYQLQIQVFGFRRTRRFTVAWAQHLLQCVHNVWDTLILCLPFSPRARGGSSGRVH